MVDVLLCRYWQAEHKACREGVILMDMSFMSKFYVQGLDAGRVLSRLCTGPVDGPVGLITYAMLAPYPLTPSATGTRRS